MWGVIIACDVSIGRTTFTSGDVEYAEETKQNQCQHNTNADIQRHCKTCTFDCTDTWLLIVSSVSGGECCSSYQDVARMDHAEQWCSNYCCLDPESSGFTLYCCESVVIRADQQHRHDFCVAWFHTHMYVPILVSLVILCGLVICCFYYGRRYIKRHGVVIRYIKRNGVIIRTPRTATYILVQKQQQEATVQDPYHVGYDQ